MPEHKPKLFSYWHCRFTPEPYAKTMQQLLEAAFRGTAVKDRLIATSPEENYYHFVNYKTKRRSYFCANFFGYEKGRIGQVIKEAFDKEEVDAKALPAPRAADGTKQQYLDGKLYFICYKNHLILAQDLHTKGRHLERYLEKIIRDRYNPYPDDQSFMLERSVPQTTKRKIKGVSKIHLSAPLGYTTKEISGQKTKSITVASGSAWKAIEAFVKDKIDLSAYSTDGFINPKDVNVTLSLSWKKKRGEKISEQIDSLANTFRHVDDELDFELETHSGKLKKDELRLNQSISVLHNNGMPDSNDIFDKMIQWYEHLVDAGDIA